jgi:hypothetical protein
MNGQDFLRITNEAFVPFIKGLGFAMEEPSASGRFYRVTFTGSDHVVSVTYEPGDHALFVRVFSRKNGELSDIDDRRETPRLTDLNSRHTASITAEERAENERYFECVAANDEEERLLLKAAKELRLVLPKYLGGVEGS